MGVEINAERWYWWRDINKHTVVLLLCATQEFRWENEKFRGVI